MNSKPRVIAAEIKKNFRKDVTIDKNGSKPQIAGELALVGDTSSEPHWAEVRAGQLVVYPGVCAGGGPVWKLPLRRLNLQPAPSGRPRGFSLTRHGDRQPIATFQVGNESDYSRWVRVLAVELLKQTPLEAVKFLDILGITATLSPGPRSLSPDCGYSGYGESGSWEIRCSPPPAELPRAPHTLPRNRHSRPVQLAQPLSLIITEEPKPECRPFGKQLSFDSSPEETPRCRVVDSIYRLAKQSKSCFTDCGKGVDKFTPVAEETVCKNRVKSLLQTFRAQETSPGPPHALDMKDDGRTGRPPLPDVVRDLPPHDRRSRPRTRTPVPFRLRGKSVDVLPTVPVQDDQAEVAQLLARCQRADRYVPVRDKKLLFESLGRTSSQPRFVVSSDNLTDLGDPPPDPPRTRSLHDLHRTAASNGNVAVKEICRYFEQRGESRGEAAGRSPSPECRLRITPSPSPPSPPCAKGAERRAAARAERRLARLKDNIADCRQTIWRLQDQSEKLSNTRRGSEGGSSRIQVAVDCRLEEERLRLKQLEDQEYLTQRELDTLTTDHFGLSAATVKVRHHSNVR